MEAHSLAVGVSFDEVVEELAPVALVGTLALPLQVRDELGTGLEEPAPFADALSSFISDSIEYAKKSKGRLRGVQTGRG